MKITMSIAYEKLDTFITLLKNFILIIQKKEGSPLFGSLLIK
jgi:hypothetical protein